MEAVLLIIGIVVFMAFCSFLNKIWEDHYEKKREAQSSEKSSFDYDAFNKENFGI